MTQNMVCKPENLVFTPSQGLDGSVLDSCEFRGFVPNFGLYIPLSGVNPPFPSSHAPCCPPQPRRSVRPRVGSRRSLDAQALREGPHLLCSCAPSHPGTGTPTASLLQPRFQRVRAGDPAMLLSGPGGCSKTTCFCCNARNRGFRSGSTLYQNPRIFGQGQNP